MTSQSLSGSIPAPSAETERWERLARRTRLMRSLEQGGLMVFLTVVSLPVLLPYFWMLTLSFSARTGSVSSTTLWTTVAVVAPAVVAYAIIHVAVREARLRAMAGLGLVLVAGLLLWMLVGHDLHVDNYRFLWERNFVENMRRKATATGQFPSVWNALFNSLAVTLAQTAIVLTAATLAGYYLSRFAFRGRSAYLQSLLVLQAFPVVTLVIPIFLMMNWLGLLDTLTGVVLVFAAFELPFFIFIMKGFFDAVPWDIEMSAMVDGATRRQAFFLVVLPQVKVGLIAVGVFAFIKGWEEYIFVRTLLIENRQWVMSLYLYFVSEDVMGVDYGIVAAVSVFYVLPVLLLYVFCQRYLTQMTLGGIKG